jgi:hypothetical protein
MGRLRKFSAYDFLRSHFLSEVRHPIRLVQLTLAFRLHFRCLRTLYPTICPFCRKNFDADRIKKIHVTKAPDETDGATEIVNSSSAALLRRVACVSVTGVSDEDTLEVLNDAAEWLSTQRDNLCSVSHLSS